jgi:hypothetical protein
MKSTFPSGFASRPIRQYNLQTSGRVRISDSSGNRERWLIALHTCRN